MKLRWVASTAMLAALLAPAAASAQAVDPKALVIIDVPGCVQPPNGRRPSGAHGMATLVEEGGYFLTAYHIVSECLHRPITLRASPSSPRWESPAQLWWADGQRDLAIVKASKPLPGVSPVPISRAGVPSSRSPAHVLTYAPRLKYNELVAVDHYGASPGNQDFLLSVSVSGRKESLEQVRAVPFLVNVPVARIGFFPSNGDSGAPLLINGEIVGMVALRKASESHEDSNALAVEVASVPKSASAPMQPFPALQMPAEVKGAQVRLLSWNPWLASLYDGGKCQARWPLVAAVMQLENASWAEVSDNSNGGLIPSSSPSLSTGTLSAAVLAAAADLEKDPDCGAFRGDAAALVGALVRTLAVARRLGTVRTLWSSAASSLVHPWTADAQKRWFSQHGIWMNPVEVLLARAVAGTTPGGTAFLRLQIGDTNATKVCEALRTASVPGTTRPPNGLLEPSVKCDARFEATFKQLVAAAALSPSASWASLATDLEAQARFWNKLLAAGSLNAAAVLAFASGSSFEVVQQREKLLATPPQVALSADVGAVAQTIATKDAHVHAALRLAREIDAAYTKLPMGIAGAAALPDMLGTFTNPAILTDAWYVSLEQPARRSEFDVKLDELSERALALQSELALAVIELLTAQVARVAAPAGNAAEGSSPQTTTVPQGTPLPPTAKPPTPPPTAPAPPDTPTSPPAR